MQTVEPTDRFLIRRADASDSEELARFAARTFSEAFGADNTPEDLALYLAKAYGPAQQGAELRDPAWTTLLAKEGKSLAGYAQVRTGPAPSCVTGQSPIELFRFYVDSPWQGQGLARRLMAAVEEEAICRGARTLWLGVWERNARGQAFYRKCGFVDMGEKSFLVGTDRQRDRVMSRSL
jgi:ribosomal protein S18 acetylase RimI-like enzyme